MKVETRVERAIDAMEKALGRRFGNFSRRELLRPILRKLVKDTQRPRSLIERAANAMTGNLGIEYDVVTDERGHTHRVARPVRFKVR